MTPSVSPELSVIMPAYNEEGAIADAVEDVRRNVFSVVPQAELVVVNDGSRDRTGQLLDQLARKDGRIRVIHQPNGGHGRALRTGLDSAHGRFVMLIDSDRQISLEDFPQAWKLSASHDAVFGQRVKRYDPKLRLALTYVVRHSLRWLSGVKLYDANVPFKLLRRSIWSEARDSIPADALAPSLFLAIYAVRRGFKIVELQVKHLPRRTGVVSIRRWKLFKFCARGLGQLWQFRSKLP